jgi:hypothetical protein
MELPQVFCGLSFSAFMFIIQVYLGDKASVPARIVCSLPVWMICEVGTSTLCHLGLENPAAPLKF